MKKAGIVAISDDGKPVKNASLMKKALQYASMFDTMVISHSEDLELSDEGVMNEGVTSTLLGLKGIPSVAETAAIARDVLLAEYLNTSIHIAHVSTEASVDIIRLAKKRGVKVTAETCPHYFSLTEKACEGFNTNAKVNPPLRTDKDVEAIKVGLADGTIDMIATDHAPHHIDEKNVEFSNALSGIVGFETAFSLAYTNLVKTGVITLDELVNKMSLNPSKMLGLSKGTIDIGKAADIIIVDLDEEYTVEVEKFQSKSKNSPFGGMKLYGKVYYTIVDGEPVLREKILVK
jgi:dihydroorotase